ncbi:MAG: AbrB/MazE/SpoVT family DNA-binding domain-containing protein [Candidatus Hodarchaeales archaeon]|jgi:AbrB family looped-hinge helix DNA binding protein
MIKARISKNGMINFPSEIRSKLNLKIGDEISFLATDEGYIIVPIKDIFELINDDELEIAKEIVKEVSEERKKERGQNN